LDAFLKLDIPKNSRILEIGCNSGRFLDLIRQQGYINIIGLDISETAISMAVTDKIQLVSYDGDNIPFSNNFFDVVLSFDVIEHIPDSQKHFSEVFRILKPRGIYFFQTPNKYFNSVWSTLESKSFTKWRESHCSLHSVRDLKKRAQVNDFVIVKFFKQSLLTEYNKQKIKKSLGLIGTPILHIVNKLPFPYTPHIWCVFQKM
jgi:2-polyprenyl-3-methyl-5-hydroxy-6-metoxy-1,4-benzoquinol methylase